jgi:hypothetical protein
VSPAPLQTAALPIPDEVTVCITSCARLDLLARTLETFRRFNTGGRYIISEDSGEPVIIETLQRTYPECLVLHGPERLGLMRSIDRLYGAVTTAYVFHLEDDWGFEGPVDWQAAIGCLETRSDVANVCVRALDEIRDKYRVRSDPVAIHGTRFQVMHRDAHPEFFGWSPNPGLIRHALYRRYAPFSRMNPDQMSALIKQNGQTMAYMLPGVARHIGQHRNVPDPTVPPRPKSRPEKWLRAVRKKLYYAGLTKSPY